MELLLTDTDALARARAIVGRQLEEIDRACSRFREDSELVRVNTNAGRTTVVDRLLVEAVEVALRAAELTDGDVDPTVGVALELAGYDRDWCLLEQAPREQPDPNPDYRRNVSAPGGYAHEPSAHEPSTHEPSLHGSSTHGPSTHARSPHELSAHEPSAHEPSLHGSSTHARSPHELSAHARSVCEPGVLATRRAGWKTIELDSDWATLRIPRGVKLDLGATAKAWAADRASQAVYDETGCGVLVSLGGDISTAGPSPASGWCVHVTDDHRSGPDAPGQTISICDGGIATSSTTVRRWRHGGRIMHHIIDPATGSPVAEVWRTVSVAAIDCTEANIAATAALVRGRRAPEWLTRLGLPARLVSNDGEVLAVGSWPRAGTSL